MSDSTEWLRRPTSTVTEAKVEALVRGIWVQDRTAAPPLVWRSMARAGSAHPATAVDTRRLSRSHTALRDRFPGFGAHRRTRRPTGAQLAARHLPHGIRPARRPRRPRRRSRFCARTTPTAWASDMPPGRAPCRYLREPRYDAMEACLDRAGPGRAMMLVGIPYQVCLDAGYRGTRCTRPRAALVARRTDLGAVLVARHHQLPLAGHRPHRLACRARTARSGPRSAPDTRAVPCWIATRGAPGRATRSTPAAVPPRRAAPPWTAPPRLSFRGGYGPAP